MENINTGKLLYNYAKSKGEIYNLKRENNNLKEKIKQLEKIIYE